MSALKHAAGLQNALKITDLSMQHVLKITDLSRSKVLQILQTAAALKEKPQNWSNAMQNKTLLMLFQKPSLRTRLSFEVGMTQMGGHAIFYSSSSSDSTSSKESIHDTAKTASRYVDIIMARMSKRKDVADIARYSGVPVINALDDYAHPCQVLADLLTIQENFGSNLEGLKLAYVGDVANNMTYDLMRAASLLNFKMTISGPDPDKHGAEFAVEDSVTEECESLKPGAVQYITDPREAVTGADIVYTDTWMSYHLNASQREQRYSIFQPYQVTSSLMKEAKPKAIFMHCLPAERGVEVSADVIDGPQSRVFDEAENRLHAQKSLLLHLLNLA